MFLSIEQLIIVSLLWLLLGIVIGVRLTRPERF